MYVEPFGRRGADAQDFDIAGTYDAMVPDAEVLSVVCEALTALDIGEFTIKVGPSAVHAHSNR